MPGINNVNIDCGLASDHNELLPSYLGSIAIV